MAITSDRLLSLCYFPDGHPWTKGNREGFDRMRNAVVAFTPDSELMPSAKPKAPAPPVKKDPFEVSEPASNTGR